MSLSRLLTVVDVVEVWTAAFPTANGKGARPTAPPLPPPPALTSQTRAFQRAQPRNHSSYLSPALRDPCSTGHSIPHEPCRSSGGQASLEPCSKSFSKFPPFEWTFRARSSAHNVSDDTARPHSMPCLIQLLTMPWCASCLRTYWKGSRCRTVLHSCWRTLQEGCQGVMDTISVMMAMLASQQACTTQPAASSAPLRKLSRTANPPSRAAAGCWVRRSFGRCSGRAGLAQRARRGACC